MNQVYTTGRFIRRGLGCNCRPGFGDDQTDYADGGGGYYDAPPADSGSDYSGDYGYGFDYYDSANGIYYDSYGNAWDVIGSGVFSNQDFTPDSVDENGFPILNINTTGNDPLKEIDLSALGQTLDWWKEINADPTIGTLPAVPVSPQLILQIPDSGIVPPGLVLPPVLNAMPPKKRAAIKKTLQNQIQKAAASGGSSGASSASRPSQVAPSANKTCPPGYTLNAAKTACMLNQAPQAAATDFTSLLKNPLVWVLVLGAMVISRR